MITQEIIDHFGKVGPIEIELHDMMPQEGVKHCVFPPDVKHNAIWDYMISPEGRHFFSLCAEGSISYYARLYEYIPDTGDFQLCFKLEDAIVTYYNAIRPSKLHTSFSFMPDGKLIMTTHTTATAPNHPEWMPFSYYDHMWEGYPGSNILIYDPQTGKLEDLGIPVPRTTIYGGVYEPTSNAYYFGCMMRGHVYKFDLSNRHLTQYGQVTENASFRFIVGPDNNVYFSTKTGAFLRINTKENRIDDLGIHFPVNESIPMTLIHNQLMFAVTGPDGKLYLTAAYGDILLRYDFETNTMESAGLYAPPVFRKYKWGTELAVALAFDKYGVLWYMYCADTICWIVSWDIIGGGEPINHGIMGTPGRRVGYVCEMYIRDDILYAADTNHGYDPPGMLSVPLDTLRNGKPDGQCIDAYQYIRFAKGSEQYPGNLAIDGERHYVQELIRNETTAKFMIGNPHIFMTPRHFLTKIWRNVPTEESSVKRVWYDDCGNVHAITGCDKKHHVVLKEGKVISVDNEEISKPVEQDLSIFDDLRLPARPGRHYISNASAFAELSGGRTIVGTRDGMLGIVKDGKVFSLGVCSPHGPVHQIVSTGDGLTAYGVAGDPSDLGTVFRYDDENGLTIYGRVLMCDNACIGGLGASCEPFCLALSSDDRWLVIGARDRMGCVYEYDLSSGIDPASTHYSYI